MSLGITYPDVHVKLVGTDGNEFSIIGNVRRAIQKKHGQAAATAFVDRATKLGSYDELLQFVMKTVDVD